MMIVLLVAALGLAQEPLPAVVPLPIDYVEYDKVYGQVQIVDCDWVAIDKEFDECLAELKSRSGVVLDVRACSTAADTTMMRILGRFTNAVMVGDWLEIGPRGSWQYNGPLVLWLSQEQAERQLYELFGTMRKNVELMVSGSQKKVRVKLKNMVTLIEAERQAKINKQKEAKEQKQRERLKKGGSRTLTPR
jgi:hypothetical protein